MSDPDNLGMNVKLQLAEMNFQLLPVVMMIDYGGLCQCKPPSRYFHKYIWSSWYLFAVLQGAQQESKKSLNLSNNQEIILSAHQSEGKIQAWRDEPSCAAARSPVVF